jgi:hypothetical protein
MFDSFKDLIVKEIVVCTSETFIQCERNRHIHLPCMGDIFMDAEDIHNCE